MELSMNQNCNGCERNGNYFHLQMMNEESFDAQVHHPFTCLVAGPSGSGKSTFVRDLLFRQSDIIDVTFDYITILLGTDASVNPILCNIKGNVPGKVKIVELNRKYPNRKDLKANFAEHLKSHLELYSNGGKRKGCVIFDDLMSDLSECGLLVDLFTKYSSHYGISVIYITQNLFFKSGGKHAADSVTLYRNTHILVVFKSPMDNTILSTLAHRLQPTGFSQLQKMLAYILEHHRYVVIFGKFDRPSALRYVTDFFATHPVPHQKVFHLSKETGGADSL